MQLLNPSFFAHIFDSLGSVAILPGEGNWGDQLIWDSTDCLLKHFGIQFQHVRAGDKLKQYDQVLIPGGGNLGTFYPKITSLVGWATSEHSCCIALPQTLTSARNLDKISVVYVREHYSLSYLPSAKLGPDLALAYQYPDSEPKKKGMGLFLRTDAEGKWRESRTEGDPTSIARGVSEYISLAGEFEEVATDRLHFAIAALGQGRKVTLLPGVYHKNRSVWEDYLEPLGCRWAETPNEALQTTF